MTQNDEASGKGIEAAVTPEQRRRVLLQRETIYTVALSGTEVQRKFLVKQRLCFLLGCLLGLAAMWGMAVLEFMPRLALRWPLFLVWLALVGLAIVLRPRFRLPQVGTFFAGWLAFGAFAGSFIDGGLQAAPILLNATLLVALPLLGCVVNPLVWKKERTPFAEFLLIGPWLVIGVVLAHFMPAGEWTLVLAGASGLLLCYLLHLTSPQVLQGFTAQQALAAAVEVVPLSLESFYKGFTGQS
jgi:FtsH-binding integral membrane protein